MDESESLLIPDFSEKEIDEALISNNLIPEDKGDINRDGMYGGKSIIINNPNNCVSNF